MKEMLLQIGWIEEVSVMRGRVSRELNERSEPCECLGRGTLSRRNSKCNDPEAERNVIHCWG